MFSKLLVNLNLTALFSLQQVFSFVTKLYIKNLPNREKIFQINVALKVWERVVYCCFTCLFIYGLYHRFIRRTLFIHCILAVISKPGS